MIGVILNRKNLITQALDQSSDEQSLLNESIPKNEWDYVQLLITENKIENILIDYFFSLLLNKMPKKIALCKCYILGG